MHRQLPYFAVAILLWSVLIGCSGDSPSSGIGKPAPEAPWQEIKGPGISLSLPPDVHSMDLTKGDAKAIVDEFKKQFPNSPEMAALIEVGIKSGTLKLFALTNTKGPTDFYDNLTVVASPAPKEATIDSLLADGKSKVEPLSSPHSFKSNKVKLSAGEAAFIASDLKLKDTTLRPVASYIILHDGNQYVFTFTSEYMHEGSWRTVAKKVMDSLKFTQ